MKHQLTDILDNCIADLLSGELSLEECLARYPEEANSLRPLLEIAEQTRRLEGLDMAAAASREAKRRMMAALDEKKRSQLVLPVPLSAFLARLGASLSGPGQRATAARGSMLATAAVALAVLLFVILPGGLFEVGRYDMVAQSAILADVVGVVELQSSMDDAWRTATDGSALSTGHHVRTGSRSSATLVFFDGSRTVLSAGTELRILQLSSRRDAASRTVILDQLVGQTENRVAEMVDAASRFEVRTPTAVAVVHGTQFTVIVGPDGTTSVRVREGEVGVTIGGMTEVLGAGQFASAWAPTTTPEPTPTGTPLPTETSDEPGRGELAQIPRPSGTAGASTAGQPEEGTVTTASPSGTPEPTGTPQPTPTLGDAADDDRLADKKDHPEQKPHPGLPPQAEPTVPPGRDPDRDKGKDKNK